MPETRNTSCSHNCILVLGRRTQQAPPRAASSMSTSTGRRAFQFNLAWLIFWTFVCAIVAGVARAFVESGEEGREYLIVFSALGVWLGTTFVAIYLRVFLQRRWSRSAAMRQELAQLVQERREEHAQVRGESTSSPSPGP